MQDDHPRVRLEALAAASWLGGESGARVLLIVASCETDKWIRNALNSAMLLLHGEVEALLSKDEFDTDDLSVDHELLLASKLEGAAKPADYRTKSTKFKDKNFARAYQLGERVFYEEGSCYTCHRDHGEGIVRVYPPLVGSEWVTGDPDRLPGISAIHREPFALSTIARAGLDRLRDAAQLGPPELYAAIAGFYPVAARATPGELPAPPSSSELEAWLDHVEALGVLRELALQSR